MMLPARTSIRELESFPWDPPAEVRGPLSESLVGLKKRCNLAPSTPYMERPFCLSSHLLDFCLLLQSSLLHLKTSDMEASFQLCQNQSNSSQESFLEKSYPLYDLASDPGYFSAGLSPTSSEDSFSPNLADAWDSFFVSCPTPAPVKKSRSRYPGKKRQTASEREKLRMRDLTKALHHLRSYLPASAAPQGQSLTKIETLRLAVRYISFLSAQLGLSEEDLEQRRRPSGQAE
ncbi:mesoderm posterior protein 1-like, partial [Hippocampus zosterae]|uniref:mesoderm posterior protein 1-like n=1 Tax=Hippocampus zosterae TaxID=109293 RepID=UPI00223CE916